MSLSAQQTIPARYLEELLLHHELPPLHTYTRAGRARARCWLEALGAVQKQPDGDIGEAGLIPGLRLLATIPFAAEASTLTAYVSDLILLWAEAIVDAARIHTYTNPRFERLRQFTRVIRVLDAHLVRAGVEVLASILLDPGEQERTRDEVSLALGELGQHAPVPAYFTALRNKLISPAEIVQRAWQQAGSQAPLEPLLAASRDTDEDWQVRLKAVEAFGKISRNNPEPTIEPLLKLRFDPYSTAIRKAADGALAEIMTTEKSL
jgi:hypothetical protein